MSLSKKKKKKKECTNSRIQDNWVSVPTNSVVTIHNQTVLLHPILDEFYDDGLNQDRSSSYAVSKGLVSTAPGATLHPPQTTPAPGCSPPSSVPGRVNSQNRSTVECR